MSSFESNKTTAIIGSILLIIGGFIPYAGAVVEIIGIILFMMAIKGFSTYYQDPSMYQNAFTGIIYYIIAAIAGTVAFSSLGTGRCFNILYWLRNCHFLRSFSRRFYILFTRCLPTTQNLL